MHCPRCREKNENEATICRECDFEFSSPTGKNHTGLSITRFLAIDIFNIVFIFLAVSALVAIFLGYFSGYFLIPRFAPTQSWVMAIQKDDNKSRLYAVNWKDEVSLPLTESEGDWTPAIHLAKSSSPVFGTLENIYSKRWDGGQVVLFPHSDKAVFTVRQNERYQVNLIDLQTGQLEILEETLNVEPFISVAPAQNLAAVSVPATEEEEATLNVFSDANKLNIEHPLGESISTKGILAPDGQRLLYTVTVSNTVTQTDTQNVYHTTLYVADINGFVENVIYEFDHDSRQIPGDFVYDFSPDSQSIVYKSPQMDLYLADLQGQTSTKVFTPTEETAFIGWQFSPGSDHLILTVVKPSDVNEIELIQVSLETGDIISFEENFPISNFSPFTFLNSEQLFYESPNNEPVIYNLVTHTQSIIPFSTHILPLLPTDMGLITFITANNDQTSFSFFNVLKNDAASALDFQVDNFVRGHDISNQHVIYQDGNTLYVKDVLSNRSPTSITTSDNGNILTHITTDPNYLLYTTTEGEQTNIYWVDLRNQQSKLLLENAQLLN